MDPSSNLEVNMQSNCTRIFLGVLEESIGNAQNYCHRCAYVGSRLGAVCVRSANKKSHVSLEACSRRLLLYILYQYEWFSARLC